MLSLKFVIHYGLHLVFPAAIGYMYQPKKWFSNWMLLLSTMLIDIDHLFSNPIFDPNRCSIHYHPLHSFPAIYIYFLLLIPQKTQLIAIGILFHLVTDLIDCSLKF